MDESIEPLHVVVALLLVAVAALSAWACCLNRPGEVKIYLDPSTLPNHKGSKRKPAGGQAKQPKKPSAQSDLPPGVVKCKNDELGNDVKEKPSSKSPNASTSGRSSRRRKNVHAPATDATSPSPQSAKIKSSNHVDENKRSIGFMKETICNGNQQQSTQSRTTDAAHGVTSLLDLTITLQQKMPETCTQNMTHCKLALFIDNSNLFIEGKKFYGRRLKLIVEEDPSFRIDIGKLCYKLLRDRKLDYGKLYGSEPPRLDSLWKRIHERGLNVDISGRDRYGKEKEVDNALTSDATEVITLNRRKPGTVILVAGDRDYCPVVRKMIKNGWTVELAAFKPSINSELRRLQTLNKQLFTITELEKIFDEQPHWYYVDRRFKLFRPNVPKPKRIPRKCTMVVELNEPINAETKLKNLQELADALTLLLQIPCQFHPCCQGKNTEASVIFFVGLVRIKDRARLKNDDMDRKKHLADFGVNRQKLEEIKRLTEEIAQQLVADQGLSGNAANAVLEEVLRNEHNENSGKGKKKIDYCNRWISKESTICDWIKRTIGPAKSCKTMVDFLQSTAEFDEIIIANKFTPLSDGPIRSQEEEDSSASYSSSEEDYSCEDYKGEDFDDDDFEDVLPAKSDKRGPMFSTQCIYSFSCRLGLQCNHTHIQAEREFFNSNKGVGARCYKGKPCTKFFNPPGVCSKGHAKISPFCVFFHSLEESRCYQCKIHGGEIGHPESDCPRTVVNEACNSNLKAVLNVAVDGDDDGGDVTGATEMAPAEKKRSSKSCLHGFTCTFGSTCIRSHTEDEKKFFSSNGGRGAPGYKSQPCRHYNGLTHNCSRDNQPIAPMCSYYHDKCEARCYFCGNIGHPSTDCSTSPVD